MDYDHPYRDRIRNPARWWGILLVGAALAVWCFADFRLLLQYRSSGSYPAASGKVVGYENAAGEQRVRVELTPPIRGMRYVLARTPFRWSSLASDTPVVVNFAALSESFGPPALEPYIFSPLQFWCLHLFTLFAAAVLLIVSIKRLVGPPEHLNA